MKYQSLESFRGVAALVVVLYHSNFISGSKYPIVVQGEVFVDFFFILSGFVMAYAYTEKIRGGLNFWYFATLRFGRLYPLHLAVLLAWVPYVLIKGYIYHQGGMGSTDPFEFNHLATFASNLFLVNSLGLHDHLSWNYPAWSISVEFFTYMIFFGCVLLLRPQRQALQFFLFSSIAYGILYGLSSHSLLATYDLGLLRCLGGFFLGAAVLALTRHTQVEWSPLMASAVELTVVTVTLFMVLHSLENKAVQMATFTSFAVLVSVFAVQSQGIVSQLMGRKHMLMLGTLSYSIYMLHALVLALISNIYQYVLKMPAIVIPGPGAAVTTLFDTPYALLINLGAVICIVVLSRITYEHIEKPWRDKFRAMAERHWGARPQ